MKKPDRLLPGHSLQFSSDTWPIFPLSFYITKLRPKRNTVAVGRNILSMAYCLAMYQMFQRCYNQHVKTDDELYIHIRAKDWFICLSAFLAE